MTHPYVVYLLTAAALIAAAAAVSVIITAIKKRSRRSSVRASGSALPDSASAMSWEYDYAEKKLSASSGFMLSGGLRDGLMASGIVHPSDHEAFEKLLGDFSSGHTYSGGEIRMKLPGDTCYRSYALHGITQRGADGTPKKVFGQIVNIDDGRARADRSEQGAGIDSLTGFCTRQGARERIDRRIRENPSGSGALFLVDVDRFKLISENIGAFFGDELLVELSERLADIFPPDSVFGRVSRDEFIVYSDSLAPDRTPDELARACCNCMEHYFLNNDQTERVTCSVGAALYPQNGTTCEQLVYSADVALYISKFTGRNRYTVYSYGMENRLAEFDEAVETEAEESDGEHDGAVKLLNAGLLSQVIEILFESRELSSSINMAISLISRRLNLDCCWISEYIGNHGACDNKYSWYSKKMKDLKLSPLPSFCQDGRYFYCRDTASLDPEQRDIISEHEKAGITSFVQCPVMDGAEMCGYISYGLCEPGRVLDDDTLNRLSLLSKIIGGYLRQLRVMQDIKRIGDVDRLTGTMSVSRFVGEAERIIAENPDRLFSIVYADIDRFKFINETYGYKAGDSILIKMSQIIHSLEGQTELVARVDADKFIGLVEYRTFPELLERLVHCDQLVNSIKKTDNDCYKLPLRAGIYLVGKDDTSVSSMIDNANLARKAVKNIHHSTYAVFDETMKSRIKRQKEIEDVMYEALDNHQFQVYIQPKFSLVKGQILGAEALVRWQRPGVGLIPPDQFIPIFEDNGFIIELDFYVLELVCRKLRHDLDSGLPTQPMSVNFSRVHLESPDFIDRLSECLTKYSIPANLIEVEITESALTGNEDYLVDVLGSLHKLGLIVSMDDFGSGYSSLNLLKKLPFDVLKIDKDFFTGDKASERERLIIANVVSMAKSLNIRVVSEGVETTEQAEFLRNINCDLVQGFLYAHPMDMESFERMYQQRPAGTDGKDSGADRQQEVS